MQIHLRRFYYSIVIVAFVIIAPILVLYATGYRYDFESGAYKTGVLSTTTHPKRSQVYLNEKLVAKKTPAVIENLKPGEYQLTIKKDGFWSWQKNVNVISSQATVLENITLIKNSNPRLIDQGDLASFSQSPSKEYIAYIDSNNLKTLKLKDGSLDSYSLPSNRHGTVKLKWSTDSNTLLIVAKNNYIQESSVLNISDKKITKITDQLLQNCRQLEFSFKNNNLIYCLADNYVWQIDLVNQKRTNFLDKKVKALISNKDEIYFISESEQVLHLYSLKPDDPAKQTRLAELPSANDFSLNNENQNALLIFDNQNSRLYLMENNMAVEIPVNDVESFCWSNDRELLLVLSELELWLYNHQKKQTELVSRLSSPVGSGVINYNNSLLLFGHDSKIKAVEAEDQSGRLMVSILDKKIARLFFDAGGEKLFYTTPNAASIELYSLTIHEKGILSLGWQGY